MSVCLFSGKGAKRPASSKSTSRQDNESISPRQAPQVVNELKSEAGSQPVRHIASHSMQKPNTAVRHVARHASGDGYHRNTGRNSFENENGTRPDLVRHVAIRSPPNETRYIQSMMIPIIIKTEKNITYCVNYNVVFGLSRESITVALLL